MVLGFCEETLENVSIGNEIILQKGEKQDV